MNEMVEVLQVIADVMKENEVLHLIDKISKHDFRVAQIIDILILEDK
ncbi:hypothetical protein [Paenisporosarcina sp. TG20]|nr:hypothetical protein [Paenisporosarcina sp. TG20]